MACLPCQQRREAIARAITAYKAGDMDAAKREIDTIARSFNLPKFDWRMLMKLYLKQAGVE